MAKALYNALKKSANRLWDKDKKVRAAVGKDGGINPPKSAAGRKRAAILQNKPAPKKVRKAEGKDKADLNQPAGIKPEDADMGPANYKQVAKKANQYDKALATKEKNLAKHTKKIDDLRNSGPEGTKKAARYINKHLVEMKDLKASISDMKSRGGPGGRRKIIRKKVGGLVTKRKTGGTIKREHGGKIQMAKASWMDGLTKKQIDEILGRPTRDSSGVKKSGITIVPKKKKKSKPIKVKPAKAGGALKPKKSAYKTGGVVKRNTGGRIAPSKGWGKARIK
jgi:hypothetical protein|tara:strand:- start:3884 stop:4723 length:840 start_codon:yes stop_codon:yes gene_type:complete